VQEQRVGDRRLLVRDGIEQRGVAGGDHEASALVDVDGEVVAQPPILAGVNRIRLPDLAPAMDTKSLIETAVRRFQAEVPALQSLRIVAGLELRGRGDVQIYRIELPGPVVTKDIPSDAKVTVSIPRSHFNELATKGTLKDWREAFEHGYAKATGIEQVMKLIVNVVDRQDERSRTRRARL
jgi:hypothetical protein